MAETEVKTENHNSGDSLGIVGLAFAVILYALNPSFITRGGCLVVGTGLCVYLAYKSHFVRNWTTRSRHVVSIIAVLALLALGVSQLLPQWRKEHTGNAGAGSATVQQDHPPTSAASPQPQSPVTVKPTVSKQHFRVAQPASQPPTTPPTITNYAPNGFATSSGQVIQPTVNNGPTCVLNNGTIGTNISDCTITQPTPAPQAACDGQALIRNDGVLGSLSSSGASISCNPSGLLSGRVEDLYARGPCFGVKDGWELFMCAVNIKPADVDTAQTGREYVASKIRTKLSSLSEPDRYNCQREIEVAQQKVFTLVMDK